jgi:hypothetical protein
VRHTAQRIFIETGSKMHGTRPLKGCLQGCYGACRGGVMQHAGYELPRISIPRTSVNRRLQPSETFSEVRRAKEDQVQREPGLPRSFPPIESSRTQRLVSPFGIYGLSNSTKTLTRTVSGLFFKSTMASAS